MKVIYRFDRIYLLKLFFIQKIIFSWKGSSSGYFLSAVHNSAGVATLEKLGAGMLAGPPKTSMRRKIALVVRNLEQS